MLEVCIDSLESAINAMNGGADELEVCSSLAEGGLTPSAGLVKQILLTIRNRFDDDKSKGDVRKKPKVNVMIRCRGGSDFCYSDLEMDTMLADISIIKSMDIDRFVFGALTSTQEIDEVNSSRVIKAAHPIPVTFHRAFDVCKDPVLGLEQIKKLGFNRVLTSGQRQSAGDVNAIDLLRKLAARVGEEIEIMPGAGVNVDNAKILIDMGFKIVHSSCKSMRELPRIENNLSMGTSDHETIIITDENIVRKMKDVITS